MLKTFGTEVLLSDDLNGIMRQTIIRAADADDLAALTPVDAGMVAYREDNSTYYRHTGTTWATVYDPATEVASYRTWTPLTLTNGFVAYSSGLGLWAIRQGTRVTIQGEIKPGNATAVGYLEGFPAVEFCSLPADLQTHFPTAQAVTPQRASGKESWALTIENGTALCCSRYTGTASTSTWMPIFIQYEIYPAL